MKTINLVSAHQNPWLRQFPESIPQWDGWKFIFNAEDEDYDYLVVFDELHAPLTIRCNPQNVIHLSTEPPLVRHYSDQFLAQFAWTIRQGDQKDIDGAIYHHPGLNWHVGWKPGEVNLDNMLVFEQIKALFDQPKTKLISVISSNITVSSQHQARLDFARRLKEHYGDKIDFYGRGFVTMDDKLEALKDYRFHVVLENSSFNHYFSEKFTDCILAGAYPIYYGCPNLGDYFPKNSFQRIDINASFDSAIEVIDHAINEELDRVFRAELTEARELILYKHNLFPMLIDFIRGIEMGKYGSPNTIQKMPDSVLMPLAQDVQNQSRKARKLSSIWSILSRVINKFRIF
tara:strand:- start:3855 stop:4889 length:1035 start_codon:yes stop_codon:yes gene_type:complete